ncbi:MAG TPA: enoyl-CoA hydratase-related protein [Syntrophomonadaceae bacterium]|nr:enoyl-CoA hydratase-related protein [Syntrophomonadaceae bacterium]
MEFKTILLTKQDGIATVQLNRPQVMNAINGELLVETAAALDEIARDDEVRVLVVKGSDKVFAAGADIRDFVDFNPLDAHNYLDQVQITMNKMAGLSKPSIASISGFALGGGCELAMACDIRIAGDSARFGLPEISLGIFPGGGGTQRLAKLVGAGKAKELILTGDILDGNTALQIGLINILVPQADLDEQTRKLAKKLSYKPPLALRMAKELVNLSFDVDMTTGLMMEKEKFSYLFATEDKTEGMKAFLEGRKPSFKGK